jgi:hypothetical protein
MFTNLYLKKDDDLRWIIRLCFDFGKKKLNLLFWMLPG